MRNPRWRKIFSDLAQNKTRTALVVMSIAIGVFAIGSILGSLTILDREIKKTYMDIDPASAVLVTTPFDESLLADINAREDVEIAEGRRSFKVSVDIGEGESKSMQLFVVDDYEDQVLNRIQAESGAFPPPNDAVLIERKAIELINAEVGNTISITTPAGDSFELPIEGLTYDLSQPSAQVVDEAYGYITWSTLESLGEERGYNQLHIRVAENQMDEDHITTVANEIRDELESGGNLVFTVVVPPPGEPGGYVFIVALLNVLGVVGSLTFLLSGFLIVNIISALLSQQTNQIGVMKAVGGRTGQIVRMYLTMVSIFGVLALLIGLPLSYVGGRFLSTFIADLSNFKINDFGIPWWVFLAEIAIGLIVPIVAAMLPVMSGTRITVREAFDSRGIDNNQNDIINRIISRLRGLPRPVLLSLRNTFRQRVRLGLTLMTLTLAGAVFATVFTVQNSLFNTLDKALLYDNYDVSIELADAYPVEELQPLAEDIEGVTEFQAWAKATGRYDTADGSEDVNLIGLPDGSDMIVPVMDAGRWLETGDTDGIVINGNISGVDVGEEITFTVRGEEYTWTVVGIAQAVFNLENFGWTNYESLSTVIDESGLTREIRLNTSESTEAFQKDVAGALGESLAANGFEVRSTATTASLQDDLNTRFNSLVFTLLALAVLLAIVGGLGIAGMTSINVIERMREIGVMRSVGAKDYQILGIFIVESIFVGVIGWVLGALLSLPISRLLSDGVGLAFSSSPLAYSYDLSGAFLWLALALGVAIISSFVPARRAAQITLREVLSYE